VDVPDIGGAAERKTSARQSQLCSTVFKLRQRAPSFNFNTISHLAVQLLKALHAHERENVEDVLEDKLRIRQSSPLLKGLLLLSETFNVTDLAASVLKRIEEVKKKTSDHDGAD